MKPQKPKCGSDHLVVSRKEWEAMKRALGEPTDLERLKESVRRIEEMKERVNAELDAMARDLLYVAGAMKVQPFTEFITKRGRKIKIKPT